MTEPAPKPKRPRVVTAVVVLLLLEQVPASARWLVGRLDGKGPPPYSMLMMVTELAAALLLAFSLFSGHRWSRIVTVVLSASSLLFLVPGLFVSTLPPASRMLLLVIMLPPILVCVMLTRPNVVEWFRQADR